MMNRFSPRAFAKKYPWLVNGLLVLVSVAGTLLLCELAFRMYIHLQDSTAGKLLTEISELAEQDPVNASFQPHPYLSFSRTDTKLDDRGIQIKGQHFTYEKPEHVIRIACLGGSTTMNAFPNTLNILLNRLPGDRKYEVMDFGGNCWTLMESTVNYLIRVSHFQPDIVLVHHGMNDNTAQRWGDFKVDYTNMRKHWEEDPFRRVQRFLIARSWMFSYFLYTSSRSPMLLPYYVNHRVGNHEIRAQASPLALKTYRHLLEQLHALASAQGARLILAPMAYSRMFNEEPNEQTIEQNNLIMRQFALECALPLAESDPFLIGHPEWFRDLVHVNIHGDAMKTLLFSQVILETLEGRVPRYEQPEKILHPSPVDRITREIVLSWDFHNSEVMDYHVMVHIQGQKGMRYLGRTNSSDVQTFTWKTGEPELSPILTEEFRDGPQPGAFYDFAIIPFRKGTRERMGKITVENGLRVMENLYY